MKKPLKASKPRDPSAHLRSRGALRTRTIPDKRKALSRKAKHKGQH